MSQQQGNVGLIGVGLLGLAMAERLIEQRMDVNGFDVDASRMKLLSAAGGFPCESAEDVVVRCDTILLSLPTSEIAEQVVHSVNPALRPGQTIIDTTTGNSDQMIALGQLMSSKDVRYAEAAVAGSSVQLRAGAAVMFLGCEDSTCEVVKPLTDKLSERCFRLGRVGDASRFKLVHNLVLGLNRAVLAEGLSFAESLGFAPSEALEILRATPAASVVMDTKGKKMVAREFEAQARLSQHLKDVGLILQQAAASKTPTPLSEVHRELLQQAEQLGFGDADNSAIIEVFRRADCSE